MLTKKNCKAYAVLAIVHDLISEKDWDDFLVVEPYLNGRENGFAISSLKNGMKVVFSENRRSDYIVLYYGYSHEFNMLGNGLTDKIYNEQNHWFEPNEYFNAAKKAVEILGF